MSECTKNDTRASASTTAIGAGCTTASSAGKCEYCIQNNALYQTYLKYSTLLCFLGKGNVLVTVNRLDTMLDISFQDACPNIPLKVSVCIYGEWIVRP